MMQRKLYFVLFFIYCSVGWAKEAMVIVHKAPLFAAPSWNAKVIQYKYRGEKIFLHDQYFQAESPELEPKQFLITQDKNGADVYIPALYVKLIYQDQREATQSIALDPDPSLQAQFFQKAEDEPSLPKQRLALLFGQGNPSAYRYNNEHNLRSGSSNYSSSLQAHYLERIGEGALGYYHFGLMGRISSSQYASQFTSGLISEEQIWEFGLGPLLTINLVQRDFYDLVFGGGFSFIYRYITIENSLGAASEKRNFSGIMISPMATLQWHKHRFFFDVDLIIGSSMYFIPPQRIKTSGIPENPGLWNQNNRDWVQTSVGGQVDVFIGLQSNF